MSMLFLVFAFAGLKAPAHRAADGTPIQYAVTIPKAARGSLHVHVDALVAPNTNATFLIPAWTPGYYQILHFETFIRNVTAVDSAGDKLAVTHASPRAWAVHAGGDGDVSVDYDVASSDSGRGFFGSAIHPRDEDVYLNGASALMYLDGGTDRPVSLGVTVPRGWKLACALPEDASVDTADGVSHLFHASGYDELIDSPIEAGRFDVVDFEVGSIPFRCIVSGGGSVESGSLTAALTKIAAAEIAVFGSAPFKAYTFFFHVGGGGFAGGLEHRNSTVIHLMQPIGSADDDVFLTVAAHELFHAWNVKWLRPAGLGPFDYQHEVRTTSLWWAEGVTDYYADLALFRSGLRDADWLLRDLASRIADLDQTPARATVTAAQASFHAWEGGSEGFAGLSYYTKGSLLGLYFDLRIRETSGGTRGLDDALRWLGARYAKAGQAYPPHALEAAVDTAAGESLDHEFEQYVDGTAEVDWQAVMSRAGLVFDGRPVAHLGVNVVQPTGVDTGDAGAVVESVEAGSAADRMGVSQGDTIHTIDGRPVTAATLTDVVRRLRPGRRVTVAFDHRGSRLVKTDRLGGVTIDPHIRLATAKEASPAEYAVRQAFLRRTSEQ